ncbi:FUSC family protein [Hoyosella sp. G463]|uniref:FUSC family protein n=1 Tax=Lolliginicoccus lacisalsi TaxID=2742202 RepID=A0A927JDL8_9ACTN|nr:FUSC family protein [Lolliginicoccus lacisalsi]
MTDDFPVPPRARSILLGFAPAPPLWPNAVRASTAFLLPALLATLLGHPREAVLCSIGALAVLYGEHRAYRIRWLVVAAVGAGMAGGFAATMAASSGAGGAYWAVIPAIGVIAAIATYAMNALRMGPPGPVFVALAASVGSLAPHSGLSVLEASSWVLLGVAGALLATMAPILVDPYGPARRAVDAAERAVEAMASASTPSRSAHHVAGAAIHLGWATLHEAGLAQGHGQGSAAGRLRAAHTRFLRVVAQRQEQRQDQDGTDDALREVLPQGIVPLGRPLAWHRLKGAWHPDSPPMITACRVLLATIVAASIGAMLGLEHPEWAMVAATLVLGGAPDRVLGAYRGAQRFLGTVAGIVLFMLIAAAGPRGLALIVVLALLLFAVELAVPRNYAIAATFITPLALLLSTAMNPPSSMLATSAYRLAETALGVGLALITLWAWSRRADRRMQTRAEQSLLDRVRALLDEPDPAMARALRRDTQFDLIGAVLAADATAHGDQAWAREQWATHVAIIELGYRVLATVNSAPPGLRATFLSEVRELEAALSQR